MLGKLVVGDGLGLAVAVRGRRAVAALRIALPELDQHVDVAPANVRPAILHLGAVAVEGAVVQVVAAIEGAGLLEDSDDVGRVPRGRSGQQPVELAQIAPGHD